MVVPAVENKGVEVNLRTSESALVPKYGGVRLNLPVSDEILGTQSCEFRRTGSLQVVSVSVLEHSQELLSYILPAMFWWPFEYLRRHVPLVSSFGGSP
ncbi:hypothetical protein Tco_0076878, partial [Tanacetum coccineum]